MKFIAAISLLLLTACSPADLIVTVAYQFPPLAEAALNNWQDEQQARRDAWRLQWAKQRECQERARDQTRSALRFDPC